MNLHQFRVAMVINMQVTPDNALKYARWCRWMTRTDLKVYREQKYLH